MPRSLVSCVRASVCLAVLWVFLSVSVFAQEPERDGLEEMENEERFMEAMAQIYGPKESDRKTGVKSLKKLAVAGHMRAQGALASFYRFGTFVEQSHEQALRWYAEAADQRSPIAMLALAEAYVEGLGTEKDFEKAKALLEGIVEKGAKFNTRVEEFSQLRQSKSRAHYLLGVLHADEEEGLVKDLETAIGYFEIAAHTGDRDATMFLAITYAEGKEVGKDIEKAKEYFQLLDLQTSDAVRREMKSAGGGVGLSADDSRNLEEEGEAIDHAISESILTMETQFAKQILNSEGEDFDAEFAAGLLQLAADGGFAEAKAELGALYYLGVGVEEDHAKASELLIEAVEQGWVVASYNLAVMMEAGHAVGVEDFEKDDLLEFAADRGLYVAQLRIDGEKSQGVIGSEEAKDLCIEKEIEGDPRAAYSLAVRRMTGWLVDLEEDETKLVALLEKSSKSGYHRALHELGRRYLQGAGVAANPQVGMTYLKDAANQNNALALYQMGICYASGMGVPQNLQESFRCFTRSAELGYEGAKNSLAKFYLAGVDGRPDEWKAAELYREAAEKGEPTACYNIGNCYLNGSGVKRDSAEGILWIRKSAGSGHMGACGHLSFIYEEGLLVEKDPVEAAFWREQAAGFGNKYSMKQTALNYFYGKGIPENRGKAMFWAEQYMAHPDPVDTTSLMVEGEYEEASLVQSLLPLDYAMLRMRADLLGDADWSGYQPEEAIVILKELDEVGLNGPRFKLAEIYASEDFAKSQGKKAHSLLKSLYDRNKGSASSWGRAYAGEAAYRMGILYEEGIGVKASASRGFKWLEQGAALGNVESLFLCGKQYVEENGPGKQRSLGMDWLIAAGQDGHVKARLLLGSLYLENPIGNLQKDTLVDWLKATLDEGYAEARALLLRFGIEYRMPQRRETEGEDGGEEELNPWVPVEVA